MKRAAYRKLIRPGPIATLLPKPTVRAEYHRISNRTCQYKGYPCPLSAIERYSMCPNHILSDPRAPFEQCGYLYSYTNKRCLRAAPKSDYKEAYCPFHVMKLQKNRRRLVRSQPPNTIPRLITTLDHHINASNPFVDIEAAKVNESQSKVLDYCSDSESDVDSTAIGNMTRGSDEDWSEAESLDSCNEDPLRFASAMSVDEALRRARDKTERLRDLYNQQLRRLFHVLIERRRDFIHGIQNEKETLKSIADQCLESGQANDLKVLDKIRALNHYRRYYGPVAILRKKMKQKRLGATNEVTVGRHGAKCVFTEGGVKCNLKTIPNSRYCLKHILCDMTQQLFHPCGHHTDDTTCREPLVAIDLCVYHMDMVPDCITYNTTLSSEDDDEHKNDAGPADPEALKSEEGEIKQPNFLSMDANNIFLVEEEAYGQEVVV